MSKSRDSPIEDITPSGSQTEHGSNVTLANLHGDLLHIFHSRVEENSEVIWMSKSFTYILFSHVQADRWRHAAELVRGLGMSTGHLDLSSGIRFLEKVAKRDIGLLRERDKETETEKQKQIDL